MRVPYFWLKDYLETNLPPREVARLLTMAGHALDKPIEFSPDPASDKKDAGPLAIMDFEDRGNRADVMGIVGLARDLAALTGSNLKLGFDLEKRSNLIKHNNHDFQPKISIETEKVIRWTSVTFKNIKIQPSVPFIAQRLAAYGLPLINNIVDLTNFVMVELGIPMHAFDLDKISKIILRSAKKGESLITFEGTKLELSPEDLVAADDKNPLTLTTAVGGRASGIDESTKNILVEAGLYHQPTARRSAIKHNVRNETSNRLGKYLHPEYCPLAVERFVFLMKNLYDADPEPTTFDYFPENYQKQYALKEITLTQERLNLVAGEVIILKEAASILINLGFDLEKRFDPKIGSNLIKVVVPYFRSDITMEDDLIEEVLRIRGYDKMKSYLPQRPSPRPLSFAEMDLENRLRDTALKIGFNEVISQPIIDVKDSQKVGLTGEEWPEKMVFLENSWNQELNLMRPEMISGQLKYLVSYQKHGIESVKIFEIGKTYTKDPIKTGYQKYRETRKAVLTITGGYLELKAKVEALLEELGIRNYEFRRLDFLFKKNRGASIVVSGEEIGKLGEVKNSVLAQFGIKGPISHAVFYIERLIKVSTAEIVAIVSTTIINYISEDYTLTIPADREVGTFITELKSRLDPSTVVVFKGIFQDERMRKENKKSVTLNAKFPLGRKVDQQSATIKSFGQIT